MNKEKKNTIWVVIVVVFALAILPFTWLFFTSEEEIFTVGKYLEKEHWLVFWGSYISFLGTVLISSITLGINLKLHKANEVLSKQNLVSLYYSDLQPIEIEIQEKPTIIPKTNEIQKLYRKQITEPRFSEFIFIRMFFISSRQITPTTIKIKEISLGLIKDDFGHDEIISGYEPSNNHDTLYKVANETKFDQIIKPFVIVFEEEDALKWKHIFKSNKISIKMTLEFSNPFSITTESEIRLILKRKNKFSIMKKYRTIKNFIYSCKYDYLSQCFVKKFIIVA